MQTYVHHVQLAVSLLTGNISALGCGLFQHLCYEHCGTQRLQQFKEEATTRIDAELTDDGISKHHAAFLNDLKSQINKLSISGSFLREIQLRYGWAWTLYRFKSHIISGGQERVLRLVQKEEVAALRVAQSLGIPVASSPTAGPTATTFWVYSPFPDTPRCSLSVLWGSLDLPCRWRILRQLRGYIVAMRNVQDYLDTSRGMVGACDPTAELRIQTGSDFDRLFSKPCSVESFLASLEFFAIEVSEEYPSQKVIAILDGIWDKTYHDDIRKAFERPWSTVKFAHGNLIPENILCDSEGRIVEIVGWEGAGWLPEWWESARAMGGIHAKPRQGDWTAAMILEAQRKSSTTEHGDLHPITTVDVEDTLFSGDDCDFFVRRSLSKLERARTAPATKKRKATKATQQARTIRAHQEVALAQVSGETVVSQTMRAFLFGLSELGVAFN